MMGSTGHRQIAELVYNFFCTWSILYLFFLQNVVLDMSGVSFIDPSAADAMSSIRDEISKKLDGRLYLASCPRNYIYYDVLEPCFIIYLNYS